MIAIYRENDSPVGICGNLMLCKHLTQIKMLQFDRHFHNFAHYHQLVIIL